MSQPASIAVVIPLYNKAPHVGRALDSLMVQSEAPDEIIIIDDASTDGGLDEVAKFDDLRIKVIRRTEPGPGGYAARNEGIAAAKSEWIAFLDADDSWHPGALAEVKRLIAKADAGVGSIFTAYASDYGDRLAPDTAMPRICPGDFCRLSFSQFLEAWLLVGRSPMWTSAVVARRSALVAGGLFPAGKCNRGGDKDMWLRLLTVGDAVCSAKETAVYHRDSVNMVTKTTNTNQRPYLCGTLESFLPVASPNDTVLIRRLINWEMYCHARDAWRAGMRVDPSLFAGFIASQNPVRHALLNCMARAPGWLLSLSYTLRDVKKLARSGKKRVQSAA